MELYKGNQVFVVGLKRFNEGRKSYVQVEVDGILIPSEIFRNTEGLNNKYYRLYGALMHSGSMHSGHYTAICFDRETRKWLRFSDDRVSIYSDKMEL